MLGVVVVPTYNERDNIGSLIEAVLMPWRMASAGAQGGRLILGMAACLEV